MMSIGFLQQHAECRTWVNRQKPVRSATGQREREREGERLAFLAKCGNLVLSYQVFTRSGAFEPTRKGNSPSKEAHSAVKTEPIHSK